jgi:hypothetical protein
MEQRMTKKKTAKTNQEDARNEPNLDSRYGLISLPSTFPTDPPPRAP